MREANALIDAEEVTSRVAWVRVVGPPRGANRVGSIFCKSSIAA